MDSGGVAAVFSAVVYTADAAPHGEFMSTLVLPHTPAVECQRQAENVDFRRNGMSFFGGQHGGVYSPYTPHHLPA